MRQDIVVNRHKTPVPVPDNLVCGVCGQRINRVVYFTDADAKPFCSVACLRKDYPPPLNLMTPSAS